jgi:hypothetical protein
VRNMPPQQANAAASHASLQWIRRKDMAWVNRKMVSRLIRAYRDSAV